MLVSALRLTLTLVLMDYEKARSRDGAYGLCALIDCSDVYIHTDRQTDRQTDREEGGAGERERDRQTETDQNPKQNVNYEHILKKSNNNNNNNNNSIEKTKYVLPNQLVSKC